jgi:molybdenum cofactor cytidylyltransferase
MRSPGLIILAAGGSTRMGRPKQLLPWRDRTLLRHACETALCTPCRPIVVVLGCESEACRRELGELPVVVATNIRWREGMGTSIATGAAALQRIRPHVPGVLFMLIDQPDVEAPFLNTLLRQWDENRDGIVATRYPEGGGVPAIFPPADFAELLALDSDRGARSLIARDESRVALVPPGKKLADLDTAEAYEERRLATRHTPPRLYPLSTEASCPRPGHPFPRESRRRLPLGTL